MQRYHRVLIAALLVALGVYWAADHELSARDHWTSSHRVRPLTAAQIAAEKAEHRRLVDIMDGGEHYRPLEILVDFPGVDQPALVPVDDVELPESTEVIGVDIDGEAYAFVIESMCSPQRHIANFVLNHQPLSVTYCDARDCVRVLSDDENEGLLSLGVGGIDIDQQMVMVFNGKRYGQTSKALPLKDVPFTRVPLRKWRHDHPESMIYIAEPPAS